MYNIQCVSYESDGGETLRHTAADRTVERKYGHGGHRDRQRAAAVKSVVVAKVDGYKKKN